jgi:hypothetical protein
MRRYIKQIRKLKIYKKLKQFNKKKTHYPKMSQGNSLCSYLKQTKMSFFSFRKSESRRVEHILLGGWYQWEWGEVGKG